MPQEIERKFLVIDECWRDGADTGRRIRQGYLNSEPACSVRVRVAGAQGYLNIKGATLGIQRPEFEYEIPLADACELLDLFCQGNEIDKHRYLVKVGEHVWEIDVFAGDNEGLVVAEIELSDPDEEFEKPDWVGKEVSDDKRYYNACLVTHPYARW
jgi:adenylate cyclase